DLAGGEALLVALHGRARDAGPQRRVDGQAEALTGRRGDDDRPVLDRQHAQRLHADPTSALESPPGNPGGVEDDTREGTCLGNTGRVPDVPAPATAWRTVTARRLHMHAASCILSPLSARDPRVNSLRDA